MMPSISARSRRRDTVLSEISLALQTPLPLLDLESSFVKNGGDSLASIRLQAALREQGIHISVVSIFAADTLLYLADCDDANPSPACGDLLLVPKSSPGTKRTCLSINEQPPKRHRRFRSATAAHDGRPTPAKHPMTEMQLSLLHSTRTRPTRNVISYFEAHRPEHVPALKRAWRAVLTREEIFRMSFEVDESGGHMWEGEEVPFVWEETVVEDECSYRRQIQSPILPGPALGYSFRVMTLRAEGVERESTVIWQVHHALVDGISCALIRSKVQRVLEGHHILPGLSFASFSSKLQSLQRQRHASAAAFWAQKAKEHPSPSTRLLLPTPSRAQSSPETSFGQVYVNSDVDKLRAYAKQMGVTVASLYSAAWGLVLARYSDSTDFCFGVVLSGRDLPIEGVQSVVGPTINTLPLYISLNTSSTVETYARQVFSSLLELTSFQWTTPSHGFNRNFSSAVNVRFEEPTLSGAPFGPLKCPHSRVDSDFPIHIEVGNCGRTCISYDTASFIEAHMKCLGATLAIALDAVMKRSATLASCLDSLIGSQQRSDLGRMGNWTSGLTRHGSVNDDLVSLFVKAKDADPSAVAVEHCSRILQYAELHEQASLVAEHLSMRVAPGDVVCVHADRTINWIVAIYAVLVAGGTYCPLDPDLPEAARDANFTTAKAKLFLTGSVAAKSAKPASCKLCLCVEELLRKEIVHCDTDSSVPRPDASAYLCFTSGSTGKPKGVICRHAGLVALQKDFQVRLQARPGWRVAQFMSPGFDGSIHEIFSTLSYGATLVLRDGARPFDHLKTCDAAILTPSMAKAFDVGEFPNLKTVYLVGEAVPQSVCDAWAGQKQLFNMYGPTEATCGATIKSLVAHEPVTIGTPNPSTRLCILDSHQRLAPLGVIGEIYIAGIQVAAGYVGLADETAKRFLRDSIDPRHGSEWMYRTGDRAYWDERGELRLMGRGDRQIKLRGFRIDLDDLEARMTRADKNCTAVAVALHDGHLVALVQPADIDSSEFRSRLLRHVPVYALPRSIQAVQSFPTTPAGKVDYKAIADTVYPEATHADIPSTAWEKVVTTSLRDVLGMPADAPINLEASFSDLGGNSVVALLLSNRLSRSFKQRVPVQIILDSVSIRELVEALAGLEIPDEQTIDVALGEHRVSPIESEWWHKYQSDRDTSAFQVTYACELPSSIETEKLVSAWNLILRRHRILSCRFRYSGSRGLLREYAQLPPTARVVQVIDFQREVNLPFDLADDDLIRVSIAPKHMLVVISHIICDLTTLRTLLLEVARSYQGRELAPLAKTYSQTTWSIPTPPPRLSFWSNYLAGAPESRFSLGRNGMRRKTWSGSSRICEIPADTHQAMLRFVSFNKSTMHQLALAAVSLALQHDTATCDIVIGAPYLNRNSEEDQDVVGLYLEPLPIRVLYPHSGPGARGDGAPKSSPPRLESSRDSFIKSVQLSSRAALSHAVPWDQLLSHLGIRADFPNHPLFDAMVTFHEENDEVRFPIDGIRSLPTWSEGAKFKIMAEFTAKKDGTITLRLEYSDECFSEEDACLMELLVLTALHGLTADGEFDVILRKLRYPIKAVADGQSIPTCPYRWPDGQGDVAKFLEGEENSESWGKQYGTVVVREPADVQTVFKDSDKHTKGVNNNAGWLMGELLGKCVGLISGTEYQKVKAAINPPFTHRSASTYLARIYSITEQHIGIISTTGRLRHNLINPVTDLRLIPFWAIADIIYGELGTGLKKELEKLVVLRESLWTRMIQGGATRYAWSQYLPTKTTRDLRNFKKSWARFNDEVHKASLLAGNETAIVLMFSEVKSGSMTMEQLLQTVDEMLFANLDVTMGGVSWVLLYLAANQDVQGQIRQEIRQARNSGTKGQGWDQYLQSSSTMLAASILESGRLKPLAAFSVPQSAPTDRVVAGFRVPAGTSFVVDTHALNIKNAYWGADGETYRPSRFLDRKPSDMRYQFWRFGFGPRQCLGRFVVDLVIRVLVAQLVEKYQLGLTQTTQWTKNPNTWILHPETEIRCDNMGAD
ncbi:hypothetical protein DL767_010883 [Monosporascus sp. MG133]|nr:hypothetical protein DL767_010883 [Monosporascus sp. MG133]